MQHWWATLVPFGLPPGSPTVAPPPNMTRRPALLRKEARATAGCRLAHLDGPAAVRCSQRVGQEAVGARQRGSSQRPQRAVNPLLSSA